MNFQVHEFRIFKLVMFIYLEINNLAVNWCSLVRTSAEPIWSGLIVWTLEVLLVARARSERVPFHRVLHNRSSDRLHTRHYAASGPQHHTAKSEVDLMNGQHGTWRLDQWTDWDQSIVIVIEIQKIITSIIQSLMGLYSSWNYFNSGSSWTQNEHKVLFQLFILVIYFVNYVSCIFWASHNCQSLPLRAFCCAWHEADCGRRCH